MGPLVPPVWTLDDSAHEFQSQGESIVAHTLFSFAHNESLVVGTGHRTWIAHFEAITKPLHQPDPAQPS